MFHKTITFSYYVGKLQHAATFSSLFSVCHILDNWREFFDRPSAQERRQRYEEKEKEVSNRGVTGASVTLPPISYIGEHVDMVPADNGIRLLHTVSIASARVSTYRSRSTSATITMHALRIATLKAVKREQS